MALRYGTHSQGILQFYLHTHMLVLIYRPRRDGRLSWP